MIKDNEYCVCSLHTAINWLGEKYSHLGERKVRKTEASMNKKSNRRQ